MPSHKRMTSGLLVSRILQAGYLFRSETTSIIFDPVFLAPFNEVCVAHPEVTFDEAEIAKLKLDAIFISHIHSDHLCFESLDRLDRATPLFIYSKLASTFALLRSLGFQTVTPLELGRPVVIGDLKVTAVQAIEPYIDCVLIVEQGNLRVLNAVDALIEPSELATVASRGPFDLVLWPFQMNRNVECITADRSLERQIEYKRIKFIQLTALKPKFIVPSSCQFQMHDGSWWNKFKFPVSYSDFEADVKNQIPGAEVFKLQPGETRRLTTTSFEKAEPLKLVRVNTDKSFEYDFDVNVEIPPTSEVAKAFPDLSEAATKAVYQFCEIELPARLKKIRNIPWSEYPPHWRLALYDQRGHETTFDYEISGSGLKLLEKGASQISYRTEIPTERLAFALRSGLLFMAHPRVINGPKRVFNDLLFRAIASESFVYQKHQLNLLQQRNAKTP